MNYTKRIGFACKLLDNEDQINGIKPTDNCKKYNTSTTTVAWLNRQRPDVAADKLWDLMKSNIESIRMLVEKVGSFDNHLRMVRLGSDILPVYTESNWSWFWKQTDVRKYAETAFRRVGDIAREHDVTLSMHPGQFCCIVSDNDAIVTRSLEELEYHADMVRWMGFGQSKLDFKINVHLSGRRGIDGFDDAWNQMSPELRNCLTLENDEYQTGLDELLDLKDKVGIVLDIHHHLIKEHEYIRSDDWRIQHVIDSWGGRRPTIHYSQSREEFINQFCDRVPTMDEMLSVAKKTKLRAHSDFYNNQHINQWALQFLNVANIMCESKSKNLASTALAKQAKELGYL